MIIILWNLREPLHSLRYKLCYINKGPDCADQSRKYLGPFIRAAARSMCRPSVGGALRNLFKTIISSEWGCPGTSISNRGHKFWHHYPRFFIWNIYWYDQNLCQPETRLFPAAVCNIVTYSLTEYCTLNQVFQKYRCENWGTLTNPHQPIFPPTCNNK